MKKIEVELIGQDGNIFNLLGITTTAMKREGLSKEANELKEKVFSSGSYDEALSIISEYVDIV